jgi:nucleoside 2-deoxyribosyltransferase
MDTFRIYLSGGMSGLSFAEQSKWRTQIVNAIKFGDYEYEKKADFFNPVNHYNFFDKQHKTEKEIMNYDLYQLRNSDLIIVNFNSPSSIGTAMELMLAKEYRIPVVAFGVNGVEVHPWLIECCDRVCDDIREVVEYVVDFYLN